MGALTTRQLQVRRDQTKKLSQKEQLQPGYMLQGRYRIIGTLGMGGFSSVYQARDMRFPTVTKLCAIKELFNLMPDPEMREITTRSFEREASMLAMLDHPAIPEVYDFFTEETRSYLVIEFIRGKDMEAHMAEVTDLIPEEKVIDWAIQVSDVLTYLHNQKPKPIVFRDLKPSNIMLDPYNRIRLIDFGIAKLFETGEKGTMVGTEGYSPPEQYRGAAIPAGDVYALGATMHHLLTRQDPRMEPPFSFADRPIIAVNPNVSGPMIALINRCLTYDAAERYPDGAALKMALMELSQGGKRPLELMSAGAAGMTSAAAPVAAGGRRQTPLIAEGDITPYWSFKCEDEIRSTPEVAGQIVLVGAYDNNLYAINLEDGKFMWKHPASDGIGSSPRVYKNSVFIGSADGSVYSLKTHNGRLNWRYETGGPVYSSPEIHFDHVFVGSDDGFLHTINSNTGRVVWKAPAHGAVRSTPTVHNDRLFFGTQGGYVFCLDLHGKVKWQFQGRQAIMSTPAVAHDLVYVGSIDSTVYALDYNSGWALWRQRTRKPIVSSAIVDEEMLYIGSSDGHLYALDALSGRKLWSFETEGQIASIPALWDDALYFGSTDGKVYSIDKKRGKLRWQFDTGAMVISSPVISKGMLFIGATNHRLYALPL